MLVIIQKIMNIIHIQILDELPLRKQFKDSMPNSAIPITQKILSLLTQTMALSLMFCLHLKIYFLINITFIKSVFSGSILPFISITSSSCGELSPTNNIV